MLADSNIAATYDSGGVDYWFQYNPGTDPAGTVNSDYQIYPGIPVQAGIGGENNGVQQSDDATAAVLAAYANDSDVIFSFAETTGGASNVTNVFLSGVGMARGIPVVTGVVAHVTTSDDAAVKPFAAAVIYDDATSPMETVTIQTLALALDGPGTPSDAHGLLSGTGLTKTGVGTYQLTGTPQAVTTELQALLFTPAVEQLAGGTNVQTSITLSVQGTEGTGQSGNLVVVTPSSRTIINATTASTTDSQSVSAFGATTITDPGTGTTYAITLTVVDTASGTLTDANGTLSGAWLTKTGVGTYQLSGPLMYEGGPGFTDLTSSTVDQELAALSFTPTEHQATPGSTVQTSIDISALSDYGKTTSGVASTISVAAQPSRTVISGTHASAAIVGQTTGTPFAGVTVANPDFEDTEKLVISFASKQGVLNGVGLVEDSPGVYELDGTPGQVTQQLDSVTFAAAATGGSVAKTGFALKALSSDGILTTDTATTVTAWRLATASVPIKLDLGATRVGGVVTGTLDILNTAANDGYNEGLGYALGTVSGDFVASGSLSGVVAAGQTATPRITLGTDTAGTVDGSIPVGLDSTGVNTGGLGDTPLGTRTVQLVGTVYATAVAAFSTQSIDFGIEHVGQGGTATLVVTNAATGTLTDVLEGDLGLAAAGPFSGGGALGAGLAAGQSQSFTFDFAGQSAVGLYDASLQLALSSHDSAQADVAARGAGTIDLVGTVENYATAALEAISGPGRFSGSGGHYTWDLGVLAQGSGPARLDFGVENAASGLADALSGSFNTSEASGFGNAGLAVFSGLAAGDADTAPSVTLSTAQVGTFSETITLDATGSNASGYSGGLAPETLTVIGTVASAVAALTITGTQAAQATSDQTAIDPFAHVTIAETGSVTETATVTLSTTDDGTLSHLGGGSYDTTTGVYTISGSAADVTAALDGLVFTPTGFQVAPGASVTTGFDLAVTSSSGATASDDTTSVVATAAAVWDIAPGATLEIPGASHGQTIDFQGTAGLLVLDQPALADLTISGFTSGDHIDLAGISPAATPVLSGGTLSIGALHLGISGDYTGQVFALVAAADGDAELMVATPITASGRQVVNLGGGDSNVSASGYANRITGTGTGDTVVTVTSGLNNSVHLGDGRNVVTTGSNTASSSITLGDGTNQVNLGGTLQTVKLGNGSNSVAMSGSNNTITAGNGPDSVTGGTGNSSVTLGGGTDSVALGGWVNSVTVGDGNDVIDAGAGSATIHLGQGNDTVMLHGRNNVVTGGNGTDSVTGGGLADTVTLGNGDDTVALGGALNVITLGDGHNTVSAGSGQDSVTVGGGANSITLAGSNNVVVGGNGADSVTGTGSYQDSVTLGDGADTVHLDGDHNTIHLGNGADSITLGGQGNTVTAGNGGVSVTGGGVGNNHVSVGTGGNSVQLGGWGNSVSIGGGSSVVDAGLGSSTIQVAGGDVSLTLHGRSDMVFLHNAAQASIADQSAGLKLGIDSGNVVASITGFGASSGAVLDLAGAGFASVAQVLAGLHSDGHGGTALALGGTGSVEFQNLAPSALHAGNFAVV